MSIGVINFTSSFVHFVGADVKNIMALSPTLLTQCLCYIFPVFSRDHKRIVHYLCNIDLQCDRHGSHKLSIMQNVCGRLLSMQIISGVLVEAPTN